MKPPILKNKVKSRIEHYLDKGITDKSNIYTLVVNELRVPRPSVRQIAGELKTDYAEKIKTLKQKLSRQNKNMVTDSTGG